MNAIQKLRQLHGEITGSKDGFKIVDAWTVAERLLARMPVDAGEVARVCKDKDAGGLDALILELEGVASGKSAPEPVALPSFTPEDLSAAMRAFRKRLKLARLNDESRLGSKQLTGGKKSDIDAIEPPTDFPRAIWKVLVRNGKLIDTGRGFYADADPVKPE